jgi:hypothetical protein
MLASIVSRVSMGRFGTPDEIAGAGLFNSPPKTALLSPPRAIRRRRRRPNLSADAVRSYIYGVAKRCHPYRQAAICGNSKQCSVKRAGGRLECSMITFLASKNIV